jgi:hypothetical protein
MSNIGGKLNGRKIPQRNIEYFWSSFGTGEDPRFNASTMNQQNPNY